MKVILYTLGIATGILALASLSMAIKIWCEMWQESDE